MTTIVHAETFPAVRSARDSNSETTKEGHCLHSHSVLRATQKSIAYTSALTVWSPAGVASVIGPLVLARAMHPLQTDYPQSTPELCPGIRNKNRIALT